MSLTDDQIYAAADDIDQVLRSLHGHPSPAQVADILATAAERYSRWRDGGDASPTWRTVRRALADIADGEARAE